jgi:hypothetical protein
MSPNWNKWNPSPNERSPAGAQLTLFTVTVIESLELS